MLRFAVLAAITLLVSAPLIVASRDASEGPIAPTSAVDPASAPRSWNALYFDASLLPGPTGWFAVPIVAEEVAYVSVDVRVQENPHESPVRWAFVVSPEADPSATMVTTGAASWSAFAHADVAGQHAECCENVPGAAGWGSTSGDSLILVAPGKPLWIALVAVDLAESDWINIRVQGPSAFSAGAIRTGTNAEAIDLVASAQRAGNQVTALGQTIAQPADASITWESARTGVFFLHAGAFGRATAKLAVDVPSVEPRALSLDEGTHVYAVAARAGQYQVTLGEVKIPPSLPGESNGLYAVALFADLDIPADFALVQP